MTIIAILIIIVECIVHHHFKNIHLTNMRERAPRKDIYFHVSESDISITTDIINLLLIMKKCMVHHRLKSIHSNDMCERAKRASATERYNCIFMSKSLRK